jgi:phosphatidylserine decarboxylase
MGLTTYGTSVWASLSILLAGSTGLAIWLYWPVAPVPALLWIWVLWFFRDPNRALPEGPERYVSPADGVVTDITPVGPDSPLGTEGIQVGVFMSVFDVHVNRAACDGRIDRIEHRDGTFLDVRKPEGWEKNESTTIYLTTEIQGRSYPVVIRQIAGLVARRIVTDLTEGQDVQRGRRIGMIRFGSRCELLVGNALHPVVEVRVGQKVRAGASVLLRVQPEPIEPENRHD